MVTLTIQLITNFASFCELQNLRVTDLQDGDRLLTEIASCPTARVRVSVPAGPCDLLIEADGFDAIRFQQTLSSHTAVLLALPEAEALYISASYGHDVAVDFDGNVRQHFGRDGRPVSEFCEEGDLLRTFDAHGRSEWIWRGWKPRAPLCRHVGTELAISALSATCRGERATLRLLVENIPVGLRIIAAVIGGQIRGRLLQPAPLSPEAVERFTLGQAIAVLQPGPARSASLELVIPYARSGQTLGVLAFIPGGIFTYTTCVVN